MSKDRVPLRTPLTPMQQACVDMVGPGYTYRQTAEALGVSVRTVRMHCEHAARKIPGTVPCLAKLVLWWRGSDIQTLFSYAHGRRVGPLPDQWTAPAESRSPAGPMAPASKNTSGRGAP